MQVKITIGSDHAGFELKERIIAYLKEQGWSYKDMGCYSAERADYPDFAHLVSNMVTNKEAEFGILMCGSGNGINMAANKHKGIRAALCWKPEIAALARQHNNANVLTLPARYMQPEEALKCVHEFMTTQFEGGRHQQRIEKIDC